MKNPIPAQYAFTFTLYLLGSCLLALALVPAFLILFGLWEALAPESTLTRAVVVAVSLGSGYFIFGLTLAAETVILRYLLGLKLSEGEFVFFSAQGFKWAFVNAMMLIVNLTFMDFMRLTPLLPMYYRLMGAKIGKRVQINTKGLADVSMIEIGDDTVLGGDAVVLGHLAEGGKLKLRKTRIGCNVTVGLGSVVMPGCQIGDGAMIAARSVLLKGTLVPPRALFAGMPAKEIPRSS